MKLKSGMLIFVIAGWLAIAERAGAEELRVMAQVVSVEPITSSPRPVCDVPAPGREAGLAAVLRWDLRGRCRASDEAPRVTGYAVEYEWDGRRFEAVLPEPPDGDRLALRLQID